MEAYPKKFRRQVLAACDAGGGTREVALRFDVSESWVRRIKQVRREQGKTAPKLTRDRSKVWDPHAEWILKKLDWDAPDFCTRGYESTVWVMGGAASSLGGTKFSFWLCGCELSVAKFAAAQPAANSDGVW